MPAPMSAAKNASSGRPSRALDPWILVLVACFNFIFLASLRASTLVREYRCFYAAGRMALAKLPLYNREVQTAFQRSLFHDDRFLPFLHAAHELLLFLPFARLSLANSLLAWRLLSIAAAGLAFFFLSRCVSARKLAVLAVMLAACPILFNLYQGQDSLLLLLLISICMFFLETDRPALAGVVLALGLFRPQVPLLIAFALVINRRGRFAAAFSLMAAAILFASFAYVGPQGVRDYLSLVSYTEHHEPMAQMANLRAAFYATGLRTPALYGLSALAFVGISVPVWFRASDPKRVLATALTVAVVVAPHLFLWEFSLLVIPVALFYNELRPWEWILMSPLFVWIAFISIHAYGYTAVLSLPVVYLMLRCLWETLHADRGERATGGWREFLGLTGAP